MGKPVTAGLESSRRSMEADGYCVLEQVLAAAEIDSLRAALSETVDRAARGLLTPFEMSRPGEPLEDRLENTAREDRAYAFALYHAVMADAHRDPRLLALPRRPGLSAAAEALLAPERPAQYVVRPRAVIPAFAAQRSPWHQDITRPALDYEGCAAVRFAFWVPLADVDGGTGALELVPGRRDGPLPHRLTEDGRFLLPEESVPAAPRRILSLRRGDVLVLDRYLPHRSLPAAHGRARWAVVAWVKAGPPEAAPC